MKCFDMRINYCDGTGENCFHCGINSAIARVGGIHDRDVGGDGRDAIGNANDGGARGVYCRPNLSADARENGRAVGGSFFGFDNFDVVAINVSLNLTPQRRARAAAAEANAFDGNVHLVKNCEGVFQAEGYAFENGADDVRLRVRGGEPDESAASVGIEMRSAFAHQIRSPEQTVGAGRDAGGLRGHAGVGIFGGRWRWLAGEACRETSAKIDRRLA